MAKVKKIIITGAAGFVGNHICAYLINRGYEITAMVKNTSEKNHLPFKCKVVIGDLSKKGKWQNQIKTADLIIHLAAQISSRQKIDFEKNNVTATKNLIDVAKKKNIKNVILFSSAAVTSLRLDEYSKTKKVQEEIIIKAKIRYAIIRPSMMYGPGDSKNVGWLISIVRKTPIVPLPGGGNFGRQPIFIGDICKVVEKIIIKGIRSEIYEIHGHDYISMKKMVLSISNQLPKKKLIINIPLWVLYLAIKVNETLMPNPKFTTDQIKSLTSGEKFKGEKWWNTFDIIPTKFEAGISEMIKK